MNDSRPPAWLREHPGAGPNLMYRQTWGTFLVLSPLYQTTSPLSLSSHAPVTRMKGNMCESHAAPDRVGLAVRFSLDLPPRFLSPCPPGVSGQEGVPGDLLASQHHHSSLLCALLRALLYLRG